MSREACEPLHPENQPEGKKREQGGREQGGKEGRREGGRTGGVEGGVEVEGGGLGGLDVDCTQDSLFSSSRLSESLCRKVSCVLRLPAHEVLSSSCSAHISELVPAS